MDPFSIVDLRIGLEGESWELDLFANNVTDERAEYYKFKNFSAQTYTDITVNRPREYGVRFMKKWGSTD